MTTSLGGGADRETSGCERLVICVDDDREFLKSLEFFLPEHVNGRGTSATRVWYRFLFIDDPLETLKTLESVVGAGEEVALLISDQMMPNMMGTDLLSRSRTMSQHSMRVLLTGHAGIESAITAINDRLLDRYLTKPIDSEEEFTLNICHILDQYEMQTTIREQESRIADLYRFSNDLNGQANLESTLACVRDFTAKTLQCREVVVIGGGTGHEQMVSTVRNGPVWRMHPEIPERSASWLRHGGQRTGVAPRVADIPTLEFAPRGEFSGPIAYGVLALGTEPHGLILALGSSRGGFAPEDLQMLGHIGDTAAVALRHQVNRSYLERAWQETRTQASQLEDAFRRLEILDRLKSNFMDFISHELRTPLSYLSATGLLEDTDDPDERRKLTSIIQDGYARLDRFIKQGLDYFHWMEGSSVDQGATCDLSAIVQETPRRWPEHTGRIRVSVQGETNVAAIAEEHAREIVDVLVDNAIKFSSGHAKPAIDVCVEPDGNAVSVTVSDNGCGFPPEWATEIMHPFTIVESKHHREGTALSLARVAAMTEAYRGQIEARSKGPGLGASFTVRVPKPAASPGVDAGDAANRRRAA